MTQEIPKNRLHLPNLTITGFRGIGELSISRLGRVTLLTGHNGVGKTTVLEAVRVFAARGRHSALSSLLRERDEYAADADGGDDKIGRSISPRCFSDGACRRSGSRSVPSLLPTS